MTIEIEQTVSDVIAPLNEADAIAPPTEHEPQDNWDMSLPPWILHFAPLALALFCLTLSLSYSSVFWGFQEDSPSTCLSLFFMFTCFLLALAATRNKNLATVKRRTAMVLSALLVVAMADEKLSWHEAIGKMAQKNISFLPKVVLHYTDDVLILVGAIIASIALYFCIKIYANQREYRPYFWCVLFFAVGHGILDILGHKYYIWQLIWPDINKQNSYSMIEQVSCFEEWFKLWTEWFFILFLLRFFYNQKSSLLWSVLIFIGSALAVFGLWGIENASDGIPYMITGRSLRYIRNYHLLFSLAGIWIAWSWIVWRLFKDDFFKRAVAGLFFLCPFYLLLPEMAEAFRNITDPPSYMPMTSALLVAIALLIAIGTLLTRGSYRILFILLLLISIPYFSLQNVTAQAWLFVKTGGILFPAIVFFTVKENKDKVFLGIVILASALIIQNPLLMLAVFAVTLLQWIQLIDTKEKKTNFWFTLVALQIVSLILIASFNMPQFIQNDKKKYKPRKVVQFEVGRQPVTKQKK